MIRFSREEKDAINERMSNVVKEIRDLFEISGYTEIKIPINARFIYCGKNPILCIDENKMYLQSRWHKKTTSYFMKGICEYFKDSSDDEFNDSVTFLKHYPKVKDKLVQMAEAGQKAKGELFEELESSKRASEALVEISLPASLNCQEIEVVEENNQKVGTINFGDMTIKLITNGDIVLVNRKKPAVKSKRLH